MGNTIASGNQTNISNYSFSHNVESGTKTLVIIVTGYDSNPADLSVKYATITTQSTLVLPLHKAHQYISSSGYALISILYIENPIPGNRNISITHAGKCSDSQAYAINLLSNQLHPIIYMDHAESSNSGTSYSQTISMFSTGDVAVGGIVSEDGNLANISISSGTEISETDMGAQCDSVAYNTVSGTISWSTANVNNHGCLCLFREVSLSPVGITYIRTGSCSKCGKCCKKYVGETVVKTCPHLTSEESTIGLIYSCAIWDILEDQCESCRIALGKDVGMPYTHKVCRNFPDHPGLWLLTSGKCTFAITTEQS